MIQIKQGWQLALAFFVACSGVVADELLVGSWLGDSIRRYDITTGAYLGDFVSRGEGGLDRPDGLAYGADGHLYVSSALSNEVLKYDGATGDFLGVFATERLMSPGNLQFGPDGLLYVSNPGMGEVVRFDPVTGDLVDVFADGGGLQQPAGLLWDNDVMYVTDFSGNAVRTYDATTGDYLGDLANVRTPLIMNLDANGDLLVSSHLDSQLHRFDITTGTSSGPALVGGPVNCPVGHLFYGDELIVASWANNRLLRYDAATGDYIGLMAVGEGLVQPNDLLIRQVPEPGAAFLWMGGVWMLLQSRLLKEN